MIEYVCAHAGLILADIYVPAYEVAHSAVMGKGCASWIGVRPSLQVPHIFVLHCMSFWKDGLHLSLSFCDMTIQQERGGGVACLMWMLKHAQDHRKCNCGLQYHMN